MLDFSVNFSSRDRQGAVNGNDSGPLPNGRGSVLQSLARLVQLSRRWSRTRPRDRVTSGLSGIEGLEQRLVPTVNQAPLALSGSFIVTEDKSFGGPLAGSDPNGDPLSFSAGPLAPAHGTLVVADNGLFIYRPPRITTEPTRFRSS